MIIIIAESMIAMGVRLLLIGPNDPSVNSSFVSYSPSTSPGHCSVNDSYVNYYLFN